MCALPLPRLCRCMHITCTFSSSFVGRTRNIAHAICKRARSRRRLWCVGVAGFVYGVHHHSSSHLLPQQVAGGVWSLWGRSFVCLCKTILIWLLIFFLPLHIPFVPLLHVSVAQCNRPAGPANARRHARRHGFHVQRRHGANHPDAHDAADYQAR